MSANIEYLPLPSNVSPEGVIRRALEAAEDIQHLLIVAVDNQGCVRLLRSEMKPMQVIGLLELAKASYLNDKVDTNDVNYER